MSDGECKFIIFVASVVAALLSNNFGLSSSLLKGMFPDAKPHILKRWEFVIVALTGTFAAYYAAQPIKTPQQALLAGFGSASTLKAMLGVAQGRSETAGKSDEVTDTSEKGGEVTKQGGAKNAPWPKKGTRQ